MRDFHVSRITFHGTPSHSVLTTGESPDISTIDLPPVLSPPKTKGRSTLRPYEAGFLFVVFWGSPCLANLFTTEAQSAQRTSINLSVSLRLSAWQSATDATIFYHKWSEFARGIGDCKLQISDCRFGERRRLTGRISGFSLAIPAISSQQGNSSASATQGRVWLRIHDVLISE